jgi:hypothetical protein
MRKVAGEYCQSIVQVKTDGDEKNCKLVGKNHNSTHSIEISFVVSLSWFKIARL